MRGYYEFLTIFFMSHFVCGIILAIISFSIGLDDEEAMPKSYTTLFGADRIGWISILLVTYLVIGWAGMISQIYDWLVRFDGGMDKWPKRRKLVNTIFMVLITLAWTQLSIYSMGKIPLAGTIAMDVFMAIMFFWTVVDVLSTIEHFKGRR